MASNVSQDTFRYALIVQTRVIGALMLREMRVRYGKSQLGYIWALAEPVGYVAIMTSLFTYIERAAAFGGSIALFFGLGVIPFRMFSTISNQLTASMAANQSLLTYPIVRELDTVLARFLLEAVTAVAIFVIFLTGLSFVQPIPMPSYPMRIVEGLALLMLFGFGVGIVNAVVIRRMPSWQNIYKILTAPLFFISAIFYSMESLPAQFRQYIAWNPIAHGVEMVRDGYYAHYRASALNDEYLLACGLVLTVIGLFGERYFRSKQ